MERFIKEYANYQKSIVIHDCLMSQDARKKALEKIDKALKLKEKELITTDETMRMILEPFEQ